MTGVISGFSLQKRSSWEKERKQSMFEEQKHGNFGRTAEKRKENKEDTAMKLVSKKRKNNKGFSLVELIVVVLIIAIIAVALAPQVMKWVGTAKKNVDENNMASIKSSIQVAIAEYESIGKTLVNTTISIDKDGASITDPSVDQTEFLKIVKKVFGESYPSPETTGSKFIVTINVTDGVLDNIKVTIL